MRINPSDGLDILKRKIRIILRIKNVILIMAFSSILCCSCTNQYNLNIKNYSTYNNQIDFGVCNQVNCYAGYFSNNKTNSLVMANISTNFEKIAVINNFPWFNDSNDYASCNDYGSCIIFTSNSFGYYLYLTNDNFKSGKLYEFQNLTQNYLAPVSIACAQSFCLILTPISVIQFSLITFKLSVIQTLAKGSNKYPYAISCSSSTCMVLYVNNSPSDLKQFEITILKYSSAGFSDPLNIVIKTSFYNNNPLNIGINFECGNGLCAISIPTTFDSPLTINKINIYLIKSDPNLLLSKTITIIIGHDVVMPIYGTQISCLQSMCYFEIAVSSHNQKFSELVFKTKLKALDKQININSFTYSLITSNQAFWFACDQKYCFTSSVTKNYYSKMAESSIVTI